MWKSKFVGIDGPCHRALPTGEFFHPLCLLAVIVLVVNDWYLKPSSWAPPQITGKLSDFAGLLFFPLLMTALLDSLLLGASRMGAAVDFTLRRSKLIASIGATAIVFSAVKLSASANHAAEEAARMVGLKATIVQDPSDLVALLILFFSWRIGLAEVRRVPLGRMELIEVRHRRDGVVVGDALHDIVPAGADPAVAARLVEKIEIYLREPSAPNAAEVEAALGRLRDP